MKAVAKLSLRKRVLATGLAHQIVGSCCTHPIYMLEADVMGSFSSWLFLPRNETREFLALAVSYMWYKLVTFFTLGRWVMLLFRSVGVKLFC
jgi:hypothetical protein